MTDLEKINKLAHHASTLLTNAASVCFIIAFCTPAWVYHDTIGDESGTHNMSGLWEQCLCTQLLRDDLTLPGWLTACHWTAVLCLVALIAAIVLGYLFLMIDRFTNRIVTLVILGLIVSAGSTMVITKAVYGIMGTIEEPHVFGGNNLRIYWGYGVGIFAVFFLFISMWCALVQVCKAWSPVVMATDDEK